MSAVEVVHIVGLGLGDVELPPEQKNVLREAEILGGSRQGLKKAGALAPNARQVSLDRDVEGFCLQMLKYGEQGRRVVLVADGDPLFFGIGSALARYAGSSRHRLQFWPNISTVQAAGSVAGIPWDGIKTVSLHGRKEWHTLWNALMECGVSWSHLCILTDSVNTPERIARAILERGVPDCMAFLAEMYGTKEARVREERLSSLCRLEGVRPFNFLLLSPCHSERPVVGMPDDSYRSDGGMMTKQPVRSVILGELRLEPGHVVWDAGAGSGSVGIEACCLARQGRVFAIERNGARAKDIFYNRASHGAWILEIVENEIERVCGELPMPDRIFVGGGLGRGEHSLPALRSLAWALRPGGVMVIACVLLGTLDMSRRFFREHAWEVSTRMVQTAVTSPLANDERLLSSPPVWLIRAVKPAS